MSKIAATVASVSGANARQHCGAEAVAVASREVDRQRAQANAVTPRLLNSLQKPSHVPYQTAKPPTNNTIAGVEWAASHDYPNEDLRVTGGEGGWPPGLFGRVRSQALAAHGIVKFSQLMAEVKSSTREEFYLKFGTCEGRAGILDTAANTMWEVCMAWDHARSIRQQSAPSTPFRTHCSAAAVASPSTPPTMQASRVNKESRASALNELLKQMQIDLKVLRNAVKGYSASQHGLNMPEIKQILSHFEVDGTGKRAELNLKLSRLLIELDVQ
jgi:hypothetical protein